MNLDSVFIPWQSVDQVYCHPGCSFCWTPASLSFPSRCTIHSDSCRREPARPATTHQLRTLSFSSRWHRDATTAEGDQGLGPNTGALAPRAQPKAGLGVGCGRGSPPPAVRVRGYHSRKILENSDAKSCILVTTCCEISCFLKTTAKKLGAIHYWSQPNSWRPVSFGPYGCCAYALTLLSAFCKVY